MLIKEKKMKSKKTSRKLVLGKATVANLEKLQMKDVQGGGVTDTCGTVCQTMCLTNCDRCFTVIGTICQ